MTVLAVDNDQIALNELVTLLSEFIEFNLIQKFRSSIDALEWLRKNPVDIAFLDINMKYMNGLSLAKCIRDLIPSCSIVFVTASSEYALEAIQMRASGYLLKPVAKNDIKSELDHILHPPLLKNAHRRIRVQCFGSFEVFVDGKPMKFQYSKTKELLAYLVDRRGVCCTNAELVSVLWEAQDAIRKRSYLSNLIADLLNAFNNVMCGNAICKQRGEISIVPERISCDYYDWIDGNFHEGSEYRGEYMSQYSWGEFTIGNIELSNRSNGEARRVRAI